MPNADIQFLEIYRDFHPKIQRYLAHLVGEGEAEDLTQEVFLKVSQALESFRGEAKLSTWLYQIATNAAYDKMRSPTFRRVVSIPLSDDTSEKDEVEISESVGFAEIKEPLVEQQLVRQQMNDCVRAHLEQLPESYRTVLVLSEWEKLKNHEIAEILGITMETVKIRLHRGKEKLREELIVHCDSYWVEENEFLPELKDAFVK